MKRVVAIYRESFRDLPREVWILSAALLINRCGSMVLPFLVLYLTSQRGFSASEAGEVLAVYGVGAVIGIILGGWLVDRLGYRCVQVGSLASSGLALIGFSFLRERPELIAGAFCLGALTEAFRPANGVALAAFAPAKVRVRSFGLNRLALNLGWSIGPAVGGLLAQSDYRLLFWVDGVTCMAAALFLFVAMPRSSADREAKEAKSAGIGKRSPWLDGLFMAAFVLVLCQALIFFQTQSTYSLYLVQEYGYSTRVFGLLMSVNTVLIVLFEMPLIHSLEKRNPLRLVAIACVLVGLGFGLLPLFGNLSWIVALIVLWTIGEMLCAPTMSAWVVTRAGPASRGAYLAAFGITFSIAATLAPLLGTRVWDRFGPDALWWGCLGLGVVAGAGFWFLARREALGEER